VLKFSEQFVKYNAIERSGEINVHNIDIATTSEGNNPIMGGFQQVSSCRMLA
jgi:hypothetical protein